MAKIRNKAAVLANGDYLIFLDGRDSIPHKSFIKVHFKLAEDGFFVAGNIVANQ